MLAPRVVLGEYHPAVCTLLQLLVVVLFANVRAHRVKVCALATAQLALENIGRVSLDLVSQNQTWAAVTGGVVVVETTRGRPNTVFRCERMLRAHMCIHVVSDDLAAE